MTTLVNAARVSGPLLDMSFLRQLLFWRHRTVADDAPEDARARRDFIQDALARNPDAFASELDVQNMMCMFPGRF